MQVINRDKRLETAQDDSDSVRNGLEQACLTRGCALASAFK